MDDVYRWSNALRKLFDSWLMGEASRTSRERRNTRIARLQEEASLSGAKRSLGTKKK